MAATHFTNLSTDQGLEHLNKHLEHVSYADGCVLILLLVVLIY